MVKIRKATLKDIERIIELYREFEKFCLELGEFKNTPYDREAQFKRKRLEKVIQSRNRIIFVAEMEGVLVGFVRIRKEKRNWEYIVENTGNIQVFYIKKEFRGKGISSQLKNAAIRWFKEEDIIHISIESHIKNNLAKNIYKKWEFQEYETEMWIKV